MKFRNAQDEKRYLALRTEIYLRVATGLPPAAVSDVLRNFGKLEALIHHEGVRQGLAVAAFANTGADLMAMNAMQALAEVYGCADTPLAAVEEKRLKELTRQGYIAPRSAWFDSKPVEFPPLTLAEATAAYGPELVPSHVPATAPPARAERTVVSSAEEAVELLAAGADPLAIELPDEEEPSKDAVDESAFEQPSFVEELRAHVQAMLKDGWRPTDWADLVMRLHLATQKQASSIDVQLCTDVGRAMLAQCGLHVSPGIGVQMMTDGSFAVRS